MKALLSIDGGGIRGIIPSLVLAEIEQATGKKACDLFDLMAGTSTGGILAILLGHGKYSAADCFNFYNDRGKEIFSGSVWRRFS